MEQEKVLVLWANTSLGLLSHWWHANKQQPGRGTMGKTAIQNLPVLDVTALSQAQLDAALALFDSICGKALLPIHQIRQDAVRHELDSQFGRNVLGLPPGVVASDGPFGLLRMKLSQEPSILGSKGSSPSH